MTKRLIATCLLAVLLALALAPAAPAAPSKGGRPLVVVILAPYLRWEDVLSGNMPETHSLAESSAVGNLNVRSLLPDAGQPTPEGGALMLSAGTWARFDTSAEAPAEASGTPAVVFAGLAAQQRANARENADIRLGTLGQAIEDAGGWTAAIGNADGDRPSRPAALVAMDAGGTARYGDISRATVTRGPSDAPFGVVSDVAHIRSVLREVLGRTPGPGLVVIDPGDLGRAHEAGGGGPDGLERPDRIAALTAFDDVVGGVADDVPEDALLVVAAPVAAQVAGEPSGFGPVMLRGRGWTGDLVSPSTHRRGLATAGDLTATILSALGVPRPPQVSGTEMSAAPAPSTGDERLVTLARGDGFMRAVDAARPLVIEWFILASVLLVAVCASLVVLHVPSASAARAGQIALLGLLSVPVASVLMYVVVSQPQSPGLVMALLLATAAIVWAVDAATHFAGVHPRPLSVLALLTAVVVVVDQWLGARYSVDGLLGYSPLVGARFYGMGNEAAALMVGGALTGCALVLDTYALHPWVPRARAWGLPLVAIACIGTAASPGLGANLGVAVWGTLAFGLAWWGVSGRRIDARAIAATLLIAVLLVAGFVALDAGGGTHLGRSLVSAGEIGWPAISALLARKAATNLRLSLESGWTALFVVLLGTLAYIRARPRGAMRDLMVERPSFSAALSACLVAAVVSYVTEDSGVIVPALLLLFPAVAVVYLMLGVIASRKAVRT